MLTGKDLIDAIDCCPCRQGEAVLWWLGQHSFVLKLGATIVYLDPFLTPVAGRLVPPLLRPEDIVHADFILGSHDHADHIDREAWPALARRLRTAKFIVPEKIRSSLADDLDIPGERFIGLDDQESFEVPRPEVTGIAAAHEFLDRDPATGQYPYLGYVVEGNGCTVYHAGDCCLYEGLLTRLRQWVFQRRVAADQRAGRQTSVGRLPWKHDLSGGGGPCGSDCPRPDHSGATTICLPEIGRIPFFFSNT